MTLARFNKTQDALLWALAIAGGIAAGSLVALVALAAPVVPLIEGKDGIVSRSGPAASQTFDDLAQSQQNFDGNAALERWPCRFGGC